MRAQEGQQLAVVVAAGGLALGEGRQEGGDTDAALEVGDDLADDRADGLGGDGALEAAEEGLLDALEHVALHEGARGGGQVVAGRVDAHGEHLLRLPDHESGGSSRRGRGDEFGGVPTSRSVNAR